MRRSSASSAASGGTQGRYRRWSKASAAASVVASGLAQHHQSLQVFALGKFERHRVVRRAAQALGDEAVDAGIGAGRGDDLVEQVGADAARTGEGEEHAARLQQRSRTPAG